MRRTGGSKQGAGARWGKEATHGVEEAVVATGEWLVTHRRTAKNHGAGFSLSEKAVQTQRESQKGHCGADWSWSHHCGPVLSTETDKDRNGWAQ